MLGREVRQTLVLGIPLILAQLGQMSMSFIDTLMVGRLGSSDLAGVALGGAVFFPVSIVCLGVLLAVSPLVSQAYGARQVMDVGRAARQGLWMSTVLSLPAGLVMWNAAPLLDWIGQEPQTVELAQGYLRAIVWGTLPLLWFGVLRQFVEGLSRPRMVMVITVGGVVLNVTLNWILMFGKLGFPALGLVGCGWASTVVYWLMFLALFAFIGRLEVFKPYGVFSRLGKPDPHYFFEILRIGWPIGIMQLFEVSLFSATAMMMGLFGTVPLAAHQIAINCAAYAFMVPLGLSYAVAVRVGQAAGRGDSVGVRQAGFVGIGLGASLMTLSAIGFWTIPGWIIRLFMNVHDPANAEVVRQGAILLGVAAVFQIFDGIQVTAAGALRGLKDTRTPMLVGVLAYWLVGLSSAWFLAFYLGWEGVGLWWGLVLGLTTAALLLTFRFGTTSLSHGDDGPVDMTMS